MEFLYGQWQTSQFNMKIRTSETRSLSHLCAEVPRLCDACCYMHWQSLIYHLRLFCTNFPGWYLCLEKGHAKSLFFGSLLPAMMYFLVWELS